MRLPTAWGVTDGEAAARYPCDEYLAGAEEAWFRAVTVDADRHITFQWLCQLKIAPYSYDLVDNFGRRSPRTLTPGAERLELGQRVMTIFQLVGFSQDEHITILLDTRRAVRVFGEIAVSYVVRDMRPGSCRLVVKMMVRNPGGSRQGVPRRLLAWGDLLMMRRQLLTLKNLAEVQARAQYPRL